MIDAHRERALTFLVWYDADTMRPLAEKIQNALGAYHRRFHVAPNLVLVNAADVIDVAGIEIRSTRTVQPHNFWVGLTEANAPNTVVDEEVADATAHA